MLGLKVAGECDDAQTPNACGLGQWGRAHLLIPSLACVSWTALWRSHLGAFCFWFWKESATSAISLISAELLWDLSEACGFLGHCMRWQAQGLSAAEIRRSCTGCIFLICSPSFIAWYNKHLIILWQCGLQLLWGDHSSNRDSHTDQRSCSSSCGDLVIWANWWYLKQHWCPVLLSILLQEVHFWMKNVVILYFFVLWSVFDFKIKENERYLSLVLDNCIHKCTS